ncbi:MAG TPA: glycosyltransferase family 4 protein [bacterium]|nr:glycosyltransferase family 4 protein [bacterium]
MSRNILYISNYGHVKGGGEKSLLTLIEALDRSRYRPYLVLPEKGELEKLAGELDIPCETIPAPRLKKLSGGIGLLRHGATLAGYIKKNKIDLVHCNAMGGAAYQAGVASSICGIPSIWHVRVLHKEPVPDRILFNLFTRTIAISKAVSGRFSGLRDFDSKISVIHNAVDLNVFHPEKPDPEMRKRLGAGDENILAAIVGRIVPYKGHRCFIEAAEKLSGNARLVFAVVGDGESKDEIEKLAGRSQAAGRMVFTGHIQDIPSVLNAIDILVLCSDEEHFGRVIIEAMACGKPVIATNAGGVPEIIDHGVSGLLFTPGNPDELAQAVSELANNSDLRKKLSDAGLQKVKSTFSAEIHAERIQAVYDSLA